MNTFRKGGKRIHNYGFFGDLSQQVLEDKLKRDRQVTEESDFKRQDFIRRNRTPKKSGEQLPDQASVKPLESIKKYGVETNSKSILANRDQPKSLAPQTKFQHEKDSKVTLVHQSSENCSSIKDKYQLRSFAPSGSKNPTTEETNLRE